MKLSRPNDRTVAAAGANAIGSEVYLRNTDLAGIAAIDTFVALHRFGCCTSASRLNDMAPQSEVAE